MLKKGEVRKCWKKLWEDDSLQDMLCTVGNDGPYHLGESEITSTLLGHSLILNHKTWGNSWEIPITSKGPMMKLNQMRSWVNLGSYAFCYKFNQSLHVDIVDCILKFQQV